jgi:hypothetical protein
LALITCSRPASDVTELIVSSVFLDIIALGRSDTAAKRHVAKIDLPEESLTIPAPADPRGVVGLALRMSTGMPEQDQTGTLTTMVSLPGRHRGSALRGVFKDCSVAWFIAADAVALTALESSGHAVRLSPIPRKLGGG